MNILNIFKRKPKKRTTAITIKSRYGDDYYQRMGALGGAKKNPNKGFGSNRELARNQGARGGRKSKRGPSIKLQEA